MVRFSRCLPKVKKTYQRQAKKSASYAVTITTGLNWHSDYTPNPNPHLRNYLWCLQRLLKEFDVKYKFYMELFEKNMAPTKVHFHGVMDSIPPELNKRLLNEFGFIKVKPVREPEVWQLYCEKQSDRVADVIQVFPMISNDDVIERYQTRYERIAEMLSSGAYNIDEITEAWFGI